MVPERVLIGPTQVTFPISSASPGSGGEISDSGLSLTKLSL